jgi:hypothetical protein
LVHHARLVPEHRTTGLLMHALRQQGTKLARDGCVWHHDAIGRACRVPPLCGMVLVVADGRGRARLQPLPRGSHRFRGPGGA